MGITHTFTLSISGKKYTCHSEVSKEKNFLTQKVWVDQIDAVPEGDTLYDNELGMANGAQIMARKMIERTIGKE